MKPSLVSSLSIHHIASLLLLAFPLAGCDVEPEAELEPEVELDDQDLEDDAPEPGADALSAAADPAAIVPGFSVEIEIVGNDVVLTWPQVQDATLFVINDGPQAYYQPGPYSPIGYSTNIGFVWGNFEPQHQFVHVGAATSASSYNYRVAAFNAPGLPRGFSTTVVKLAQPLVAGANMVSMPLIDSSVDDAQSLHAALGGFGGPLGQLTRWDENTQSFYDWNPWSGQPGFDIEPGEALFVHTSGPGNLVMVGHAPTEDGEVVHQIVPGWNLVAAPMDINPAGNPFGYNTASMVAVLMAQVQQLAEWNPATQTFVSYQHPSGWGTNFSVEANQPIWVQANAPSLWD